AFPVHRHSPPCQTDHLDSPVLSWDLLNQFPLFQAMDPSRDRRLFNPVITRYLNKRRRSFTLDVENDLPQRISKAVRFQQLIQPGDQRPVNGQIMTENPLHSSAPFLVTHINY